MFRIITRNRAKCRSCGDVVESLHRHDFAVCFCGALAVDGGTDYLRRSARSPADVEEMSEFDERGLTIEACLAEGGHFIGFYRNQCKRCGHRPDEVCDCVECLKAAATKAAGVGA